MSKESRAVEDHVGADIENAFKTRYSFIPFFCSKLEKNRKSSVELFGNMLEVLLYNNANASSIFRENSTLHHQVEQMLQKISPLQKCQEELGSLKAELEEKKVREGLSLQSFMFHKLRSAYSLSLERGLVLHLNKGSRC